MPEKTTNTATDKAALRRTLLAHRQAIQPEVRALWNAAIGERVLAWWNANPAQVIGVYWPIRGEPDLRDTYAALIATGAALALPIVTNGNAPLTFVRWRPDAPMVKDAYGVMVPQDVSEIVTPDALLVPCVGFNAANYRLGYGGGFYDRTLAVSARPLAVGIAYACCRAEFTGDVHDIALDDVITEASPLEFAPVSL
ncbi:MAG TPA: 5-formyltetrahydrofolate cyclo-ligase [Noviherbaspirillum sp.]|jgi:5,10-methenyltetrahydrofolate synthetase